MPFANTYTLFPVYIEYNGKRPKPNAVTVIVDHVNNKSNHGATDIVFVKCVVG